MLFNASRRGLQADQESNAFHFRQAGSMRSSSSHPSTIAQFVKVADRWVVDLETLDPLERPQADAGPRCPTPSRSRGLAAGSGCEGC